MVVEIYWRIPEIKVSFVLQTEENYIIRCVVKKSAYKKRSNINPLVASDRYIGHLIGFVCICSQRRIKNAANMCKRAKR